MTNEKAALLGDKEAAKRLTDAGVLLMQGDCLELLKDIPDGSVDMVLTDIPYGVVNRDGNGLRNINKGNADTLTFSLDVFLPEIYRAAKNSICVFCGKEQFSEIYEFFSRKPGTVRAIVWQKTNPSPMNGQYVYLSGVELAVWFKKAGGHHFTQHCKNTVFRYPSGKSKIHPTQKNLSLIQELVLDNTLSGDLVLDTCMGSGTTGVACVNTGREFIGMELDPGYFEVAKRRIREAQAQARLAWNTRAPILSEAEMKILEGRNENG